MNVFVGDDGVQEGSSGADAAAGGGGTGRGRGRRLRRRGGVQVNSPTRRAEILADSTAMATVLTHQTVPCALNFKVYLIATVDP